MLFCSVGPVFLSSRRVFHWKHDQGRARSCFSLVNFNAVDRSILAYSLPTPSEATIWICYFTPLVGCWSDWCIHCCLGKWLQKMCYSLFKWFPHKSLKICSGVENVVHSCPFRAMKSITMKCPTFGWWILVTWKSSKSSWRLSSSDKGLGFPSILLFLGSCGIWSHCVKNYCTSTTRL